MKHIFLVRHAKSSWDHPGLSDLQRPLNARGIKDAPAMAKIFGGLIPEKYIGVKSCGAGIFYCFHVQRTIRI
ncbi:MAG: hypothetical protein IPN15_21745 [Saprospiraceae bacterium]|nr:hypothetical protein [Candidatus Vicinibacter affinis]